MKPQEENYTCSHCNKTKKRIPIKDCWISDGKPRPLWLDIETNRKFTGRICVKCRRYKRFKVYNIANPNRCQDYLRTLRGFIMTCYCNMEKRCSGKIKRTNHIYEGLEFPSKDAFYKWALKSRKLRKLHSNYTKSGFKRRFSPSIDRIDSSKGYTFNNMRWITNYENIIKRHVRAGHKIRKPYPTA